MPTDDKNLLDIMLGRNPYSSCALIKELLHQRYDDYIDREGNPEVIDPCPEVELYSETLKSLFTSKSHTVLEHKKKIKRIFSHCPFCGLPSPPNTLDHYLPRSVYPEYSILSKNLIPCCSECNTNKSTHITARNGKRSAIHVYYDTLWNRPLIQINIEGQLENPRCKIEPHSSLNDDELIIVKNHIETFKIQSRYKLFIPSHYFTTWDEIYSLRELDQHTVSNLLTKKQESAIERFSPNYWKAVLLNRIITSNILNYMLSHEPPETPTQVAH